MLLTMFDLRLMAAVPQLSTDCVRNGIERQWRISAHLSNERSLLTKIYLNAVANATFKVVVIVASALLLWAFKSERH